MNPEDKKYILENIGKKAVKDISGHLGIKEKHIRRFIEKESQKKKAPDTEKPETESPVKKTAILFSIILIMVLGFGVYLNSLEGLFIWDDDILIKDNSYIKDPNNIPGLFTKDITYRTSDKSNFYRPLQMLTYALDHSVWKLNPKGYHLTSIIFHILVAILVYCLARLIFKNALLSAIAGILFVTHPIHTTVVDYISSRADSMAALFVVLTVIFYIKYVNEKNKLYFYSLSILSYLASLSCKEIAIFTPFILVAYDYTNKDRIKFSFMRHLPFFAIGLVYIILRKTILDFPTGVKNITATTTLIQRIPLIFGSLATYFRKLLMPLDLHIEYPLVVPKPNDIHVITGVVILLLLVLTAIFYWRKEKGVAFLIGWFFITYLPISNLYLLNAFFSENWIYIPSIALFTLAAFFLVRVCRAARALKFFIYALLVFLIGHNSYLTIKQNRYWSEPEHFYRETLKYNPDNARVYFGLAFLYFNRGMIDKGIEESKKALAIKPDYAEAYENLAYGYLLKGRYDEAVELCQKLLVIKPNSFAGRNTLGNVYFHKGIYDKAIIEYDKVIAINPYHAVTYNNLGVIYYNEKKYDLAIEYFDKAIALGYKVDPNALELLKQYRK